MTIASRVLACGAVLLGLGVAPVAPAGAQGYHVARTVVLGGDGGWDYVALDTVGRRLFIARQDRVMVVDPASGKVLAEIPGLNRAHGIAFSYETGRGFATSGADSAVTIFDLASLRVVGRSEEHTSELQSRLHLVCRLLLEKKNNIDPHLRAQRIAKS